MHFRIGLMVFGFAAVAAAASARPRQLLWVIDFATAFSVVDHIWARVAFADGSSSAPATRLSVKAEPSSNAPKNCASCASPTSVRPLSVDLQASRLKDLWLALLEIKRENESARRCAVDGVEHHLALAPVALRDERQRRRKVQYRRVPAADTLQDTAAKVLIESEVAIVGASHVAMKAAPAITPTGAVVHLQFAALLVVEMREAAVVDLIDAQ